MTVHQLCITGNHLPSSVIINGSFTSRRRKLVLLAMTSNLVKTEWTISPILCPQRAILRQGISQELWMEILILQQWLTPIRSMCHTAHPTASWVTPVISHNSHGTSEGNKLSLLSSSTSRVSMVWVTQQTRNSWSSVDILLEQGVPWCNWITTMTNWRRMELKW